MGRGRFGRYRGDPHRYIYNGREFNSLVTLHSITGLKCDHRWKRVGEREEVCVFCNLRRIWEEE